MSLAEMQMEAGGVPSVRAADEVYPGLSLVVTIVHLGQAIDLNSDLEDLLGLSKVIQRNAPVDPPPR